MLAGACKVPSAVLELGAAIFELESEEAESDVCLERDEDEDSFA